MPDPQLHSIRISRTAHYATLGKASPQVRTLILACHGYGQVPEKFIKNFEPIMEEHTLVVAPEGLSTFYWGGFDGPTVSSWMTRRHRLDEIADFSEYLSDLLRFFLPQLHSEVRCVAFGFSQGCATVMRWAMRHRPEVIDRLIFWAGSIPEDIDYSPHRDWLASRPMYLCFGDQDPLLTEERKMAQLGLVREKGLGMITYAFEGAHDIPADALRAFWKKNV